MRRSEKLDPKPYLKIMQKIDDKASSTHTHTHTHTHRFFDISHSHFLVSPE